MKNTVLQDVTIHIIKHSTCHSHCCEDLNSHRGRTCLYLYHKYMVMKLLFAQYMIYAIR